MNGFPGVRVGRKFDRNPVEACFIGLMEFTIERGGIIGGGERHLAYGDVTAAWGLVVLQIETVPRGGQGSVAGQEQRGPRTVVTRVHPGRRMGSGWRLRGAPDRADDGFEV